jgi:hypothetical protein
MRIVRLALILVLYSWNNISAFSASRPESGQQDTPGRLWMASVGSVFLDRSRPDPNRIVSTFNQTNTISSGSDFNFDLAAGPDLSLARWSSSGDFIEVRYFSVADAEAAVDYGNAGPIQIGRFGLTNAEDLSADYESSLHSGEINWGRPVSNRVTWLMGFRWLEFDETLHFHVTRPTVSLENDLYWEENNRLHGGQFGGSFDWLRRESPLSIRSTIKAGAYGNMAYNDVRMWQSGVNGAVTSSSDENRVAFVGDVGVVGTYQIGRHVSLRSSYQLLWLESVATASDQAGIATNLEWDRQIDTDGGVFYHGVTAGLDFTW